MRILFVNPPIYDFAAFDLWAKPLGLLYLAATARAWGCEVMLLDFLDVHLYNTTDLHAGVQPPVLKRFGTAQYPKCPVDWPLSGSPPPRTYYRYGISQHHAVEILATMPTPDLVVVTSHFTYTYPGVQDAIRTIKHVLPHVPVWLGGTYAQLCPAHAQRHSGADLILTTSHPHEFLQRVAAVAPVKRCPPPKFASFAEWPAPALDLYPHLSYIPWRTSRGCVNSCAYCATPFLCPRFEETLPAHAADAFLKLYDLRPAPDVAFYDDALLVNASKRLLPFLDHVCTALPNLRWHTPNGMHVRCVTAPIAERLYAAGFTTLRLGLETVNPARLASTGPKYAFNDVARCLSALTAAGFRPNTIGVYLLMGLPGQTVDEVRTAILYTREYLGLNVKLAEYSPVPHTSLWPAAVAESPVPIAREPLWHNNSLLPLRSPTFSQEIITDLRALAAGH